MTEQQIIETLATKVMGWKTVQRPVRVFDPMYPGREIDAPHYEDEENGTYILVGEWNPLKRIDHAWEVVEKFKAMRDTNYEAYRAFYEYVPESIYAITPEAICNAALKVIA